MSPPSLDVQQCKVEPPESPTATATQGGVVGLGLPPLLPQPPLAAAQFQVQVKEETASQEVQEQQTWVGNSDGTGSGDADMQQQSHDLPRFIYTYQPSVNWGNAASTTMADVPRITTYWGSSNSPHIPTPTAIVGVTGTCGEDEGASGPGPGVEVGSGYDGSSMGEWEVPPPEEDPITTTHATASGLGEEGGEGVEGQATEELISEAVINRYVWLVVQT